MSAPRAKGKFDQVHVTFCSHDEVAVGTYLRLMKPLTSVCVEKLKEMNLFFSFGQSWDVLILPVPNAFGIVSPKLSFLYPLFRSLGPDFEASVQDYIFRKYLGEQPVYTSFMLKSPIPQFKYIIVVSLFRILSAVDDEAAWMDPGEVPSDWAYNAMRSALLRVLRWNVTRSSGSPTSVLCLDFYAIKKECVGGDSSITPEQESEKIISQKILALLNTFEPKKIKNLSEGISIHRKILCKEKAEYTTKPEELLMFFTAGTLESRGLFSKEEVEIVLGWIQTEKDPRRRKQAAKVIAAALQPTDNKHTYPPDDVAVLVTDKTIGCFPYLIELASSAEIVLHNEIPISEIKTGEEIGQGMSGSVYRGYWKDKRVAVKVFKPDIKISDFIKELSIMSIVRHKNLVRCYGGVTKGGKFMIIAELLQENLNSLLAFNEIELSLGLRLQMAVDVARALTYLHNHCNLMHRDLKTLNLLVTTVEGPELVVKVCDFGVSRVIDKKRAMTGNIGTVAWIAPEIFQQKKYTEKADIYSFGIVMWEIITRQTPFGNLSSFGIPVAVIKGDRPPFAKEKVPSSLKKLVRSCWSSNQKKRPPVHKVLDSLLKIYNNLAPSETSQKNIDITPIFKSPLQRSATRSLWTRRTTRQLNYVPTTETQTLIYNSPPPKTPSRSLKRRSRSRVNSLQQEVLPKVPEQVNTSITDEESSEEAQLENENEPEEHDESEIVDFAQNTNTSTVTCIIPPIWSLPTAQLEVKVNRHFSRLKQDLEDGTILVSRQRYLLFRAENFVSDIIRTIQVSFDLPKNEEISDIANSFLYSLGSYIGKEDSKELFKRTALTDKVTKITSAFVNIAYTGLAYANLLPESEINEKHLETTVLHVELEKSYEFKRQDKDPLVFTMAAGYIAGWCESVIGQRFQYVEVNQVEEKLVCQFIANDDKKSARVSTSKNHTFVKTKDSNVNWLPKLIKTTKKKQNTSEVELQVAAKKFPSPAPFEAEDTIDEINNKTAEKFDSFFLDPTQATVELAEEHCLLLQTNSIATGIHELFTKSLKSENSTLYSSKLLYNFGFQVAKTNFKWFMEITRLGDDVIERALSLPVNLAYLGWCDLHFVNMSEMQELSKSKENFSITITSETAYEATSIKRWLQNNSSKYKPKCCCFVLSGYIAGWFESCFGISCKCIETECRLNDANCTFFVYHNNKLIPKTKDPSSIEIIRYTSIVSLSGSSEERRLTPNEEKISLIMKPQLSDVSLVSKDRKQLVRSKSTDSARSSVITDAKMAKEMFSGSLTSEVDNKYGISPVPGQIQPTKETRRSKEKTTRKGKRSKSTHKSAEKKLKMREEKDFFRTTDDFTLPPSPPLPATASPLNFIPVSIFSTAPRSNSPAPGPAKKAPQARRLSINKRIHYEITKTLTGEKEKVPSELHDDINKKAQSSGIPSRKFGSKHSSSEVPELINNEDDST